jgi:hypothetical protein
VETWEWEKVVHGLGLPSVEFQMLEILIKAAISEFAASDGSRLVAVRRR